MPTPMTRPATSKGRSAAFNTPGREAQRSKQKREFKLSKSARPPKGSTVSWWTERDAQRDRDEFERRRREDPNGVRERSPILPDRTGDPL